MYIYTHHITQHYSTCLCRDISTMLSVPLYRKSAQKNSPKLHSIRRTRRTAIPCSQSHYTDRALRRTHPSCTASGEPDARLPIHHQAAKRQWNDSSNAKPQGCTMSVEHFFALRKAAKRQRSVPSYTKAAQRLVLQTRKLATSFTASRHLVNWRHSVLLEECELS